jgi:hypothetical protein
MTPLVLGLGKFLLLTRCEGRDSSEDGRPEEVVEWRKRVVQILITYHT